MNEILANKEEQNQFQIWFAKYWMLVVISGIILQEILSIWIPKRVAYLLIILALINLFFFSSADKENWFYKKFDNKLKGSLALNTILMVYYFSFYGVIDLLAPMLPSNFIPVEIGIGIVVLSFFVLVAMVFIWITKSTKR